MKPLNIDITGLAHELWAMSQGPAPIDDAVAPIMAQLLAFAERVRAAEREACAKAVEERGKA